MKYLLFIVDVSHVNTRNTLGTAAGRHEINAARRDSGGKSHVREFRSQRSCGVALTSELLSEQLYLGHLVLQWIEERGVDTDARVSACSLGNTLTTSPHAAPWRQSSVPQGLHLYYASNPVETEELRGTTTPNFTAWSASSEPYSIQLLLLQHTYGEHSMSSHSMSSHSDHVLSETREWQGRRGET
ncbi:hypothetical protein EYF80_050261 [Liparis tanakae]|uniref:Uncharacterized protein n=1 Tax=Liparis tanakae TaxID=230148 RepID=A0A4Z2FEK8_9TELE|nr:hypothetical protein EYF80_050261 [Liparis tanakae]